MSADETYTFSLAATGDGTTDATPNAVTVAPSSPPSIVDVSGTLTANTTWSPQLASAYVTGGSVDIPAGVTLTLDPGTVVKASGGTEIDDFGTTENFSVEGTLDAVGTATNRVIFTSINDNSVGGTTGDGSPAAGDWAGISGTTTATIDVEDSALRYAIEGIDISGGSGEYITIDSDVFMDNGTAVSVSAALGTNANISYDTFNDNSVSIDAESNWIPIEPCYYNPTIYAEQNSYDGSETPPLSTADYLAVQAADQLGEEYPDNWPAQVGEAGNDVIEGWSILGCILPDPLDPLGPPLAACSVVALPLSFDGAVSDIPVVCPDP
jgi:hypothetical protein